MSDKHSRHSTLRERIVEHRFVADVLQYLWTRDIFDVEVLRPEFDGHGYDLVMTRSGVVRHIQLKTGKDKRPDNVQAGISLVTRPSGCLIWIEVDDHLNLKRYFWFGGPPGEPLPPFDDFGVARRPTRNKLGERPERSAHRIIPKTAFQEATGLEDVLTRLFGALSP